VVVTYRTVMHFTGVFSYRNTARITTKHACQFFILLHNSQSHRRPCTSRDIHNVHRIWGKVGDPSQLKKSSFRLLVRFTWKIFESKLRCHRIDDPTIRGFWAHVFGGNPQIIDYSIFKHVTKFVSLAFVNLVVNTLAMTVAEGRSKCSLSSSFCGPMIT